jgi:hypothetical protein
MKNSKMLLLFFILAVNLIPISTSSGSIFSDLGAESARRDVEKEALSAGAPIGFFNVKWLASMGDVRRSHPNALLQSTLKSNDTLSEREKLYGKDIVISYIFQNDNLIMFIINFTESGSVEKFQETQTKLVSQYGPMPDAKQTGDCKLSSAKTQGRFALEHCLREYPTSNAIVEQIIAYRTKR